MGAAMADNLRLRVVLDLVDRVLSPLKRISAGGTETARALKAAKDQLKQLNAQQAAVKNVQDQSAEFQRLNNQLKQRQALLDGMRARGDATRTAMAREENAVAKLTAALKQQREAAGEARRKLNEMGVTGNLSAAQARLKTDIDGATAAMAKQRAELAKMGEQQRKLAELRKKHGSEMMHVGMMAAGSAALMAGGNKMAGPLRSVVGAFMPAENSETQLRASMMTNTGAVGPEFQQILDLATRLGDRLPGTTADFIDMMTMLRRQGMTSKAILGGLGESAAYLGIQLRMPVTAAAEFASKMQDATQTAEGDMMGLMDTIQRAYYLGVDPTNMLQGFTKISAVMPFLGEKGLQASKMLAPLLVMMDQTGMAGESAGNAIRKVVQLSLDADKLAKTNKMLAGEGIQLNFATKGGKFAGLDNLFAQLDKLKGVDSDVKRIAALKKLYGDDAETHQVLNTLMEKGLDGYREVVAKMEAQADLRKRVDSQLKTLSASAEAAQGSFTNMLKDMGATIAPDLVLILNKLGELANSIGAWTRENQTAVKWVLRVVGVLSVLAIGMGALGLSIASVLGPMLLARFFLARMGLTMAGAAAGPGLLARAFGLLKLAALGVGRGIMFLGRALLATPLGRAFSLLAFSATMVYNNWEGIKGGLVAIWEGVVGRVKEALSGGVREWAALLADFSPWGILYSVVAFALDALGIEMPARFSTLGSNMIQGLVNGITAGAVWVKDAVVGVAQSAASWFAETLGIASPSRLFMQYGEWVSEGAALGIQGGQGAVRNAALAMATAAGAAIPTVAAAGGDGVTAMPVVAKAAALRIDTRGPLTAQAPAGAPVGAGVMTISITINAAPGQDERAIARAVAAEFERQTRQKQSRVLSQIHDID